MKQCERSGCAAPAPVSRSRPTRFPCTGVMPTFRAAPIKISPNLSTVKGQISLWVRTSGQNLPKLQTRDPARRPSFSPPTSPPSQTKIQGALRAGDLGLVFLCPAHSLPN